MHDVRVQSVMYVVIIKVILFACRMLELSIQITPSDPVNYITHENLTLHSIRTTKKLHFKKIMIQIRHIVHKILTKKNCKN